MRAVLVPGTGPVPSSVALAVRRALREAGRFLRIGAGDVVVRFTDATEMQRLNRRWRRKNQSTDVLAFPSHTEDPSGRKHVGDIALCLDVARLQARRCGHPLTREAAVLALHGLLHLLGHDHESDRGEMMALENRLRRAVLSQRRSR